MSIAGCCQSAVGDGWGAEPERARRGEREAVGWVRDTRETGIEVNTSHDDSSPDGGHLRLPLDTSVLLLISGSGKWPVHLLTFASFWRYASIKISTFFTLLCVLWDTFDPNTLCRLPVSCALGKQHTARPSVLKRVISATGIVVCFYLQPNGLISNLDFGMIAENVEQCCGIQY
jgi:hypothetical protein